MRYLLLDIDHERGLGVVSTKCLRNRKHFQANDILVVRCDLCADNEDGFG
jgi:hypothetical protein